MIVGCACLVQVLTELQESVTQTEEYVAGQPLSTASFVGTVVPLHLPEVPAPYTECCLACCYSVAYVTYPPNNSKKLLVAYALSIIIYGLTIQELKGRQ